MYASIRRLPSHRIQTEAMAQAIGAGITAAGKSADVVPMETISPADLKDQAVWVLGCPAMGAEELEDGTVEPFVSELEGFASGKKVFVFLISQPPPCRVTHTHLLHLLPVFRGR